MIGIIGKKVGMTQFFKEDGTRIPVTLIEAGPCQILQIKTESIDGYAALQIGFGETKERLLKKPLKGHLKKSGAKSVKIVKELRLASTEPYKVGELLDVDLFDAGDFVDVIGISIGKGFQGGVKRWNWRGGKKSHGSMFHRRVGSIGASSYPSRVHKGKTMPGRMGGEQTTVQNLEIVKINKEKHLMAVKGSVPGNENSYLMIKEAKKKPKKEKGPKDEKANDETKEKKEDRK